MKIMVSDLMRGLADAFRVALLSYAVPARIYASSKSRWDDFNNALSLVWENCVKQGSGGAYLVPRMLPSSSLLFLKGAHNNGYKAPSEEDC